MLETRDDAAVTCVSDDLCLVQTVDCFTAIVDTQYWFGQLAAANGLSDVNAMGARSLIAMNTLGPVEASLVGESWWRSGCDSACA
jgi:selenide,water dikinase